jgi:hypothetical protein
MRCIVGPVHRSETALHCELLQILILPLAVQIDIANISFLEFRDRDYTRERLFDYINDHRCDRGSIG